MASFIPTPSQWLGGEPFRDDHQPDPKEGILLLNALRDAANAGSGGLVAFETKALMDADLDHDAGTVARVYQDSAGANNGDYVKVGASGSGSWSAINSLDQRTIRLTLDDSASTANTLVATTDWRLPAFSDDAVFLITFDDANTGAMTLAVNGAAARPLISNLSGAAFAAGVVLAGRMGLIFDDGTSYRLLIDGDGSNALLGAEAARDDTETFRDETEAFRNQAEAFRNQAEAIVGFDGTAGTVDVSPTVEGASDVQAALEALEARSTDLSVQKGGTLVASQPTLDFVGSVFSVTDDAANNRVRVEFVDSFLTPQEYGAVADGETDDSAAYLAMAAAYRDVGGKIVIPPGQYKLNLTQSIDLRRSISRPVGLTYEVDATGAVLDFSDSPMTSGFMVRLGATAQANINEVGLNIWRGGIFLGPVTEVVTADNTFAKTTVGLEIEWMYEGHISDLSLLSFWRGMQASSSFHFKGDKIHTIACGTGILLQNDMTVAHWSSITAKNGRFGLVCYPYSDSGSIYGQTFSSINLEGNEVGAVLDPRSGNVRAMTFDGVYLEAVTFDGFRVGKSWDESDAALDGSNRTGRSDQLTWRNGLWDGAWNTSIKRAIKFNDAGTGSGQPDRILIDNLPSTAISSANTTDCTSISVRP